MPVFVLRSKIRFSRGFSKFPGRDRPVSGLQNRVANRVAKQGRKTGSQNRAGQGRLRDRPGPQVGHGLRSATGRAAKAGGDRSEPAPAPNRHARPDGLAGAANGKGGRDSMNRGPLPAGPVG